MIYIIIFDYNVDPIKITPITAGNYKLTSKSFLSASKNYITEVWETRRSCKLPEDYVIRQDCMATEMTIKQLKYVYIKRISILIGKV